jgi:hypothetical protein
VYGFHQERFNYERNTNLLINFHDENIDHQLNDPYVIKQDVKRGMAYFAVFSLIHVKIRSIII